MIPSFSCFLQLKRIPKEIGKFRKCLEELYLDSNIICDMSRTLFQCQMLKKLTLSDNEIYIMPPWINCLWNLRELNMSKNALLGASKVTRSLFHIKYQLNGSLFEIFRVQFETANC